MSSGDKVEQDAYLVGPDEETARGAMWWDSITAAEEYGEAEYGHKNYTVWSVTMTIDFETMAKVDL